MFVHRKHGRRGAGALMMEWGMDKAKEKKIETFVEATDMGKSRYERFGLREMYVVAIQIRAKNGRRWRENYFPCITVSRGSQLRGFTRRVRRWYLGKLVIELGW